MSYVQIGISISLMVTLTAALRAEEPKVSFAKQILPLLQERCFRCHEGRDARAGVRLDLRAELVGEKQLDPLVVIGKSHESRLLQLVSSVDPNERMPPDDDPPLKTEEIAILARWIDEGLAWDGNLLPEEEVGRDHWAFQPIVRPEVPIVADDDWSHTPIDRFVFDAQRTRALTPAKEAPRRVLIRRMYFDLLGVPPTWDEVAAFVADERVDAIERLVEKLLADPRYGERWGRHWLDIARWAESEGFESNHPRPFAWRYRDYVVDSLNADKPYAQFLTQQLAGDELPEYTDENLIATGFLAAARISSNEEDKWLQHNDVTVDIVNALGSAVLGLTLHCAQCHDHKFDPLSAKDYYSLHAFFARGIPVNVELRDPQLQREYAQQAKPEYEQAVALQQTLFAQAKQRFALEVRKQLSPEELAVYDKPLSERTPQEEVAARKVDLKFQKTTGTYERHIDPASRKLYDELKQRIKDWEAQAPPRPQTYAFYSPVTSSHALHVLPSIGFYPLPYDPKQLAEQQTYIMQRGDVHRIGPAVEPAFPEVLQAPSANEASPSASPLSRRDLAAWLTRDDHPLVARVWANRVWHYHFGRGLVATCDDFGPRGARPSHPALLDWLAAELLTHDGSTKHLHRLILNSATYRQAASVPRQRLADDPDNQWLTRWAPRRLEAEAIRDAWLAVSGELERTLGGVSVPVVARETSHRRSLYLFQRRGHAPDAAKLFDGPQECAASITQREVSTSPLQALYLLNSKFSVARAQVIAKEIDRLESSADGKIRAAFRRILLRKPDAMELSAARSLTRFDNAGSDVDSSALELLCQSLLNLNEFNYLE